MVALINKSLAQQQHVSFESFWLIESGILFKETRKRLADRGKKKRRTGCWLKITFILKKLE